MKSTTGAPLLDESTSEPSANVPLVKHVALVPAEAQQDDNPAVMFERFARDPNISVEKIERLMALWERNEERRAKQAFNRAMAAAQKEMKAVVPDAYNTQTKSHYASYEALDGAIRPIYTKHGFGLSFDTADIDKPETVRVLCYASHDDGFERAYHIDMPADGKGAKGGDVMTKTHATGSALSYGQRYLLRMIFNMAVEKDDDGNKAGQAAPPAPKGYQDWLDDLTSVADEGTRRLEATWKDSKAEFKTYLVKHERQTWEGLKAKAARVAAS